MNDSPATNGSPALSPEDSTQVGRKRQRSQSMESEASASSLKRAVADPESQDSSARTPRVDQLSNLSLADSNLGIDAYMAEQGEDEVSKATIHDQTPDDGVKNLLPKDKWALVEIEVKRPMKVGETWYLVERGWWKRWRKACTGEIDKDGPVSEQDLGPLDNAPLLDSFNNLKLNLAEGIDFEYVPEETWQHLTDWYGEAIKPLPRRVIERGATKQTAIELRPPTLNVLRLSPSSSAGREKKITISAGETVKAMNSQLAAAIGPPGDKQSSYRVWKINPPDDDVTCADLLPTELSSAGGKLLADSDKTLEEEGVQSEDWFVVEFQLWGAWIAPEEATTVATVTAKAPSPLFKSEEGFFEKWSKYGSDRGEASKAVKKSTFTAAKEKEIEPGTLGLGNMGNTCFMNSAIQCLAHNKELSDYFLTGLFKEELNPDNPLGMGGAIAESFGSLLHRIWAKTTPSYSYSPRDFKMQLQRFAPQFSGYQQHDSQELVAFLLDGLHEDLNRVLKKPYVEKPDWEGGNDVDLVKLAQKSWEGYMMRNDSVIVDLFQGQYQSTLVCPVCNKVSITFDPFMYLTLPLPIQKKWKHKIYYIPWDLNKPHVIVPVEINANSTFKDLRNLLGKYMEAPPENLLTLEIFSNKFYKNLDDNVMVGDMASGDIIVCFELPCNAQQTRSYKRQPGDPILVPVYLSDAAGPSNGMKYYNAKTNFGYPFIVPIYEEAAKDKDSIYEFIVTRLQRWTSNARDLFTWEEGPISQITEVNATGLPPVADAITEIKENGEVVTVTAPEPPEEEGDIVDEKAMVLDEDVPAASTEPLQPKRVGPKKDLFNLKLQIGQKAFGTEQYSRYDSKTYESWADRMKEAGPEAPLIKEGDALHCEFDDNIKAFFFGESPQWEHGLWETWEKFEHPEYLANKQGASDKAKKNLTLQDCLEEFTKEEKLGEEDLWYCPQCKEHQPATKKFQLWTTPDILVVHLKRFSNNRSLRDKIDAFIDFPIEGLDLSGYVGERATAKKLAEQGVDLEELQLDNGDEPLLYDLFAVDEHMGGLGGGHYRAYALNHANGKWYHFDDSHVSVAKPEESINSNAYLLFYRRRSSEPLGGKSHHRIEEARAKAEAAAANPEPSSADTTQEEDSQEMKVDPQLPTPPNEQGEISGTHPDDVWKNINTITGMGSSAGYILPDFSMLDGMALPDTVGEGDATQMKMPDFSGYKLPDYGSSWKMPDYSFLEGTGYRMPAFLPSFEDPYSPMGLPMGHMRRFLRDEAGENDSEQDSANASDYPDPSLNVSPSSSNAAEIDPDDLDDIDDEDWGVNIAEEDPAAPKPLPSRANIAALKKEVAEKVSASEDKEVSVQVKPVEEDAWEEVEKAKEE